ncbi:MAG: bacteriohemerythrin [Defluviitaleaceae bacterium]|nr:bacteriohemerythrin [Defluviitaleaceae bacterium]
MTWNRELETGNSIVDDQHKEIFSLVGQVLEADTFSNRREKTETAMGFLADYAVRHFASEEELMTESEYPQYKQHKALHDDFVKKVVDFIERYQKEGDTISISETINAFVIVWLKEHIMTADKEMAAFYKDWKVSK